MGGRRPILVLAALASLLVPSAAAAGEATVVRTLEREDHFEVEGATCRVRSFQRHYSDGTVELETRSNAVDPTEAEACFWGAIEARVRYTYRDVDGDLQSGEAVAPRLVIVRVPVADGTDLQSLHSVTYFNGSTTPDYPLPK